MHAICLALLAAVACLLMSSCGEPQEPASSQPPGGSRNPVAASVEEVNAFARAALQNVELATINRSDRKLLALYAYMFGAVHAISQSENLTPPQAHAVALAHFTKQFEMAPDAAARIAQFCIDATASDSKWNPCVHQGVDDYLEWRTDPEHFKAMRLASLLENPPNR